ncbi:MAG: AraC family transcriptional regulator ligand-binding domain-containing protein, partial [Variovorax paradoxus]
MTLTHHTVAIQQVHSILMGARHRGIDAARVLVRAGIAPSLLESPLARISQRQYALLIRALRRELRDEIWGL